MALSVFDLFKVGIGPSSSHTVGPMRAANAFIRHLLQMGVLEQVSRVKVVLFGSLSATGIGHGTDRATMMGLMGETPEQVQTDAANQHVQDVYAHKAIMLGHQHRINFDPHQDMTFDAQFLPYHPNAMTISAYAGSQLIYTDTYYSVGGGFIVDQAQALSGGSKGDTTAIPYPFSNGRELLQLCCENHMRISDLMMENEKSWRSEKQVREDILAIWHVMQQCVQNGLAHEGVLPGGLGVQRRAAQLYRSLQAMNTDNVITSTLNAMEWVNLFALAVAEENAAGGRVVTAPTNGAAGVIPAVLHYFMKFSPNANDDDVVRFFLSATAVGILCKINASISGAEVGCQGEIGSACAMAAAGLAEVMGATPQQVENAAEIALEHNLGLTCDPVAGLVQVPCIERNAVASVKAINAVQLALRGNGAHFISLDKAIHTMKITGIDMSDKYKETSRGGLADNSTVC